MVSFLHSHTTDRLIGGIGGYSFHKNGGHGVHGFTGMMRRFGVCWERSEQHILVKNGAINDDPPSLSSGSALAGRTCSIFGSGHWRCGAVRVLGDQSQSRCIGIGIGIAIAIHCRCSVYKTVCSRRRDMMTLCVRSLSIIHPSIHSYGIHRSTAVEPIAHHP